MDQDENQQPIPPAENDIPEEQASQQALIPFMGDELAAAMTEAGIIYISLPEICRALGLTVQPQLLRIKRTRSLFKGLRRIQIATRGGPQRPYCLRVDKVALWLGGIETSRMKNEEFRAKIEVYQDELAPAATEVFMRVVGLRTPQIVPSQDPQIIALAEQIDLLMDIASFLREHMEALLEAQGHVSMQLGQAVQLLEALTGRQATTEEQVARIDERTKRLTSQHARQVQLQVERMARDLSKQRPQVSLAHAHALIYGRLKTRFQAGSYKEIPDEQFDVIMTYLRQEAKKIGSDEGPSQGSLF